MISIAALMLSDFGPETVFFITKITAYLSLLFFVGLKLLFFQLKTIYPNRLINLLLTNTVSSVNSSFSAVFKCSDSSKSPIS
jgi:hypothetical protein